MSTGQVYSPYIKVAHTVQLTILKLLTKFTITSKRVSKFKVTKMYVYVQTEGKTIFLIKQFSVMQTPVNSFKTTFIPVLHIFFFQKFNNFSCVFVLKWCEKNLKFYLGNNWIQFQAVTT